MLEVDTVGHTTRDYLKAETRSSHDRLDTHLGALVAAGEREYVQFLRCQYSARIGVEQWLASAAAVPAPPLQTPLIAQDLAALGASVPRALVPFSPPSGDGDSLGVRWVLAGSSLGNRAILAQFKRSARILPTAFLSDGQMTQFWHELRPELERPHDAASDRTALLAARATFAQFNACVQDNQMLVTA